MINNINYTIKIDLKALHDTLFLADCLDFNVTPILNDDGTYTILEDGFTGSILEMSQHFYLMALESEKQMEDELIEYLKNDDLDYVCEFFKGRK